MSLIALWASSKSWPKSLMYSFCSFGHLLLYFPGIRQSPYQPTWCRMYVWSSSDRRMPFLLYFFWLAAKQVLGKRLEVPSKSIGSAVLKGRECRPKVKITSMSVKSKTMFIKTKTLIDKSAALFCVFQTFCVSLYANQEKTSKKPCTQSISKGKFLT